MTSLSKFSALVLIDPAVQDYQHLVDGAVPGYEVLVLDAEQDGVEQITRALAERQNLTSLHLVSHGQPGELALGSTTLRLDRLKTDAAKIRGWAKALKQQASIWLYGCRVAAGEAGQAFLQTLHQLTGANIAASTHLTGQAAQGGDWNLAYRVGAVQPATAFAAETLATYAHTLPVLVDETFRNSTVSATPWLFGTGPGTTSANPFLTAGNDPTPAPGGIPGGATALDPAGSGALRLTDNSTNQAAFVIYNSPIASNAGLSITFDFFAYAGTGTNGAKAGGDGISFFLIDGAQSPTAAGAFGGSLGYAQKQNDGIAGIVGGYLGVGIDEFGNFANPFDGGGGGQQRVGGPGEVADAVTIRGLGSGLTGYDFIATSGSLAAGIDNVAATSRDAATRRARIDITPAGILSVRLDLNNDGDFLDVDEAPASLSNIDIIAENGGSIPATFKFGFASSTGDATNIHEVRNLVIETFSSPPTAADAAVSVSPGGTVNVVGISATDAETAISSYTIVTLPDPAQGTLFLGDPAAGGTPIAAGQVLTPAQLPLIFFQAQPGFTGGSFTYTATDTDGDADPTPATVTLTRVDNNLPPVLPDSSTTPLPITNPTNLTGLEGQDPDGSIDAYVISAIPTPDQGTLFLGDPAAGGTPVSVGQRLTPAQISQLFFNPGTGFSNTSFTYAAVDNLGGISNPRTITLSRIVDGGGGTGGGDDGSGVCGPGVRRRGTRGNNRLIGTAGEDRLRGLRGNDFLDGRGCNDVLQGGRGNDRLFGKDAQDRLLGQQNNDRLNGGKGNDQLGGGLGSDRLRGGPGRDTLFGRRGNDILEGQQGSDRMLGQAGRDRLRGGGGNDTMLGNQGNDNLDGGRGDDLIDAGLGRDFVRGRPGSDTIFGRRGNDRILGGSQADNLHGGIGNDVLIAGGGADTMTGGSGSDRFLYRNIRLGADTITDFESNDLVVIRGRFGPVAERFERFIRLQQVGADTVVRFDRNGRGAGGNLVTIATLLNVDSSNLTASNFQLGGSGLT